MLRSLLCIFIAMTGIGCSSIAYQPEDGGDNAVGTRADWFTCPAPESGVLLSLFGALLPNAVEGGIDFLASYLEEESKKYDASYGTIVASEHFYQKTAGKGFSVRKSCIAIARGKLAVDGSNSDSDGYRHSDDLGIQGAPYFYLEMGIVRDTESPGVFRLRPVAFSFNKPKAERGSTKDVLVKTTFTFGAGPNARVVTIDPPFLFETVSPGTELEETSLSGMDTKWEVLPAVGPEIFEKIEEGQKFLPVTAAIEITETDKGKGGKVLAAVSKAISDSKAELSKAVVNPIEESLGLNESGSENKE